MRGNSMDEEQKLYMKIRYNFGFMSTLYKLPNQEMFDFNDIKTLLPLYEIWMGGREFEEDPEDLKFMGFAPKWGKKKLRKEPIEEDNDVYTMQEFINCCKSGGFINYDGFGKYSNGKEEFYELEIRPSDIMKGNNVRNFSHVVWYNR